MLNVSHAFAGICVLQGLNIVSPEMFPMTGELILYSALLANLPDVDGLKPGKLKDHHNNITHTPIFWIGISLVLFGLNSFTGFMPVALILLFTIQTQFHLLCDFLTGRSTGPRLLYPISNKNYGIVKLTPSVGDFDPFAFRKEDYINYFKKYAENKWMVGLELFFNVAGALILFFKL